MVKTGFRSARQEDVHRAKRSARAKEMIHRGGAEKSPVQRDIGKQKAYH